MADADRPVAPAPVDVEGEMADMVRRIVVDVPLEAGHDTIDAIWTAVADAAHDAQPEDRAGWDVFVYSTTVDADDA